MPGPDIYTNRSGSMWEGERALLIEGRGQGEVAPGL